MSRYLLDNIKTGDFNPQRTLSGLLFVIPERLASVRAIVLAFTANKQTNTVNYIYIYIRWGNCASVDGIPDKDLPTLSWHYSCPVWSLTI